METIIDRNSYRRENIKTESVSKKAKKEKTSKLYLDQIILAMSIIIAILIIKIMHLEPAYVWIDEKVNSGISYKIVSKSILEEINKIKSMIKVEDNVVTADENISQNVIPEEVVYETAVEGINQLSDDAKKVKEQFEIIRPLEGTITSVFGCRVDDNPIVSSYHTGLDIAASSGTQIVAAHDGEVIAAEKMGTYGLCVMIKHEELLSVYAHCSKINTKRGAKINKGEKIGEVGMTGNATGPHLHFEIRYEDRFVNPEDVF